MLTALALVALNSSTTDETGKRSLEVLLYKLPELKVGGTPNHLLTNLLHSLPSLPPESRGSRITGMAIVAWVLCHTLNFPSSWLLSVVNFLEPNGQLSYDILKIGAVLQSALIAFSQESNSLFFSSWNFGPLNTEGVPRQLFFQDTQAPRFPLF